MASQPNGTPSVGVTGDLVKRVWQHREHVVEGFTSRCGLDRLVSFGSAIHAVPYALSVVAAHGCPKFHAPMAMPAAAGPRGYPGQARA